MEYLVVLIGIAGAAFAGFLVGQRYSTSALEKEQLLAKLAAKEDELTAYRNKVNHHFEKTAKLFNQVSDSYQSLYDHMASSSSQLCASETFTPLTNQSEKPTKDTQLASTPETPAINTDVFDADRLYKAHEYRNQIEDLDEELLKEGEKVSNIVDIESAKEDSKSDKIEPALDYAIKKEGVINHNSLDVDGVKTS